MSARDKRRLLARARVGSTMNLAAPVAFDAIEAAADGEAPKLKSFSMLAYSGGTMNVGLGLPVVVDIAGLRVTEKARPILHAHDPLRIVGHTTDVEKRVLARGTELRVAGVISAVSSDADSIVLSAANGFPWQASIGARIERMEFVDKGESAAANGRTFKGPLYIVRASSLGEVSFVALGADDHTSATIAASAAEGQDGMEFNTWLTARGFAADTLNAAQIASLRAIFDAEVEASADTDESPAPAPAGDPIAEMRASAAAEATRIAAVRAAAGGDAKLEARAIAEGWTPERTELESLRAARGTAPAAIIRGNEAPDAAVLEAGLVLAGKGDLTGYNPQILEAADKRWRGRMRLQQFLLEAAQSSGAQVRMFGGNEREVLRAAFSNASVPGILSNVANKFLHSAFLATESAWRRLSAVRSVNDFKDSYSYRLVGNMKYEKVAPTGELKHGTLSESAYSVRAETYGKIISITRRDIVNDDLGALTSVPAQLGRGAALALNEVFWTEFMSNSTFFETAKANYFEGAGTVLSLTAMSTAVELFRKQTDPAGNPLGVAPKLLVVPPALETAAKTIHASTELRDTTASTRAGTANIHAGQYEPIVSSYLSNTLFGGNSATAWYLLADPEVLATMETVFLNGVELPTIETADADFSTLGIEMRAFHDFGCSKHEFRAGVKSKGAA